MKICKPYTHTRIHVHTDHRVRSDIPLDCWCCRSLYFCDWGIHASIKHCDLAGTDCVYVAQRLGWPNNIVLDIAKAHIYWTDAKRGIIESARFDGYDRRVVTRFDDCNLLRG